MGKSTNKTDNSDRDYWSKRYLDGSTGWDIGYPSTPIKAYIDQLKDKNISILIPGAGNAYEADYLWKAGFKDVFVLDISEVPLARFQERNPDFPSAHLILGDFFTHFGQYDLILEQTFFCALNPTDNLRNAYAKHMSELLAPNGKLVGLWFDFPLDPLGDQPPHGGDKMSYLRHLEPYFETITFMRCYNSIVPRQDSEIFGIFKKKGCT
tara:strand:- start:1151 stop:1777 length:627 start_codon:yes stop_codon:yes gene_type:complete